ncbi:MAG: NAD(P)-binding protein, partial [Ilumatobacteraceae bacterium]
MVVGAGAAGCVIAARLAEVPGDHVTLVEAGPGVAGSGRSDEPGRLFPGPFARGRGIGGSGAVNGMLATPGDLGQYERWGWTDAGDALARVLVPLEIPAADELGPLDRALLAAAPDATT